MVVLLLFFLHGSLAGDNHFLFVRDVLSPADGIREIFFYSGRNFHLQKSFKEPLSSEKCSVLETHGTRLHYAVVITVNLLLV